MPRKRTGKKKTNGKRRNYRRRGTRASRVNLMGYASGMPMVRRTKHRYVANISITSSTGLLSFNLFRANSLFDPEYTNIGHQPMGFDQMAALYNHYCVIGSRITLKAMPNQATDVNTAVFGVYISDDTTIPYTNYSGFMEAKRGTYKTLVNQRNQVSLSTNFSTKKFFNASDVKDIEYLWGTPGTNPAEEAYFCIWYQNLENPGETSTHNFLVTVDYIAEWKEPKDLAQS